MPRWVDIEKIQRKFEGSDEVEPLDLWVAVMCAPYWDVDVEPVEHGRCVTDSEGYHRCSACNEHEGNMIYYKYCPHCGAKMDLKDSQTSENTCVACGVSIPEGQQVCRACDAAAVGMLVRDRYKLHDDVRIYEVEEVPDGEE